PTEISGELRDQIVIEAGAELVFAPGAGLTVAVSLAAQGTAAEPVRLRAEDPSRGWLGLRVRGEGATELRHVLIEDAGATPPDARQPGVALRLERSASFDEVRVERAKGAGVYLEDRGLIKAPATLRVGPGALYPLAGTAEALSQLPPDLDLAGASPELARIIAVADTDLHYSYYAISLARQPVPYEFRSSLGAAEPDVVWTVDAYLSSQVDLPGSLTLRQGATLQLGPGASLRIEDGGRLTLEPGATVDWAVPGQPWRSIRYRSSPDFAHRLSIDGGVLRHGGAGGVPMLDIAGSDACLDGPDVTTTLFADPAVPTVPCLSSNYTTDYASANTFEGGCTASPPCGAGAPLSAADRGR
ncbi:MAG TPA: hypothetical protein VFS00_35070, partial [Polyangiaceae bacterium]|nr:hypothetical protein [Polyangiaceae bacterium]